MSNTKTRASDGLKYVTRRLESNPKLIQTISDSKSKPKRIKKTKLEVTIITIDNILKSHK